MVADVGYAGDMEVEIFNAEVWATDGDEVFARKAPRADPPLAVGPAGHPRAQTAAGTDSDEPTATRSATCAASLPTPPIV